MLQTAEIIREEFGRTSVEPNLKEYLEGYGKQTAPYFAVIENEFDVYVPDPDNPKKRIIVKEKRNLVYCNDLDGFEEYSREKRGIDKDKKLVRKINIDGGGDHLKVSMNLMEERLKPNAPKNPKHQKRRHKDSSVKATYIIACVEAVAETRDNVHTILNALGIKVKVEDCLASDLKLINIVLGLQGHSSTHPCPYCEWNKNDPAGKGNDRNFEGIR